MITRKNKFLITSLIFTVCISCFAFFGFSLKNVSASASVSVYLPQSMSEHLDLNASAPISATVYDGGASVITENKKLYIYNSGEYVEYTGLEFNNPSQIRRFGNNHLLVNDDLKLFTIDLSDLTKAPQPFTYGDNQITSSYFDINGRFLASISNNQVSLFELEGENVVDQRILSVTAKLLTPVCVSENGNVFFIRSKDSKLCCYGYSTKTDTPILMPSNDIKIMLSKNGNLYFTMNNSVWRINENTVETENVSPTLLSCGTEFSGYDLGSLENPTDMHFYGDNLVITDSRKCAVQQFEVQNDTLVFTGKAIAKGKTAFNRISDNGVSIVSNDKRLAVLDDFKLSIIENSEYDSYDKNKFTNFFVEQLDNPTGFALGKNSVMLKYPDGVKIINLQKNNETLDYALPNLKSVIFFNDNYYLLTNNGSVSAVYCMAENDAEFTKICEYPITANVFTVDVFKNVYMYNQTDVYKNGSKIIEEVGITQLFTDLNGNLYSVKQNRIRCFNNLQNEWQTIIETPSDVKSVASGIYTNDLYILLENSEFIYRANPKDYACISSISVPDDYTLTDGSAKETLKVYMLNDGAYAYTVQADGVFKYDGQVLVPEKEYAFVCNANITDINGTTGYVVLAGEKGVILTHLSSVTEKPIEYDYDIPSSVFVATDVNVYYYPIITKTNVYAVRLNENVLRLKKEQTFSPEKKLTFCGIDYYYAEVDVNGEQIKGYVPVNFTVKVLSEDLKFESYKIEHLSATSLYSDYEMTDKLLDIAKNQMVRVYANENGVLKVSYKTENGYVQGYVSASCIIDSPNIQIRNILLVLAVSACLCGSITFFVLRSKRD